MAYNGYVVTVISSLAAPYISRCTHFDDKCPGVVVFSNLSGDENKHLMLVFIVRNLKTNINIYIF
jgi:hypothetical protein